MAYIVGMIGDAGATPALITALRDEHGQVRFAALHALRTLGAASHDAVKSMRDDPDARVRSLVDRISNRK